MRRAVLVLAWALSCFSMLAAAQTPAPGKNGGAGKAKDSGTSKAPDKTAEPGKGAPKAKAALSQAKLPKNAIVVVADSIFDAMSMFPKSVFLSLDEYQNMLNEIEALKKQLKSDRKRPSSCILHGRLERDHIALRAEFGFSTEQPGTAVVLGLQGGHLNDAGDLDGAAPNLELSDEGFVVRVEKVGNHRLTLNLGVPVQLKKATLGPGERGIELGLPGAAATIVHLELPANIKELRWNDTLEKMKRPGRWQINGLERSKTLTLSWKEPVSLSGNAPLIVVERQIKVQIDEKYVSTSAELLLEDQRAQTREWRFVLPAQAKVDSVKAPSGLTYEWLPPTGKAPYHTLRASEATAERWQVLVHVTAPRPNGGGRVPIGPFQVLGAYQQQGTIKVQMPTEVRFGQRLVFVRSAEVFPLKSSDTESVFQYVIPTEKGTKAPANAKAPLELEWRFEKNQLETQVEHLLKLKAVNHGWDIAATTKIQIKSLFAPANAVEVKLPMPRPRGLPLIGAAAPLVPFPGAFPWGGLWQAFGMPRDSANPDDFIVQDEQGNPLKLTPQGATGKVRIVWDRTPTKQMTILLKNTFRVPEPNRRLRVELPRPLNTVDRGAKLMVQCDDRMELLQGLADAEEPVPDRRRYELNWDLAPAAVDLAWRPHRREVVAQATIDVTLHARSAQVRQAIRFPLDRSGSVASKSSHVQLHVPRAIQHVQVVSGGELVDPAPSKETLWLRTAADAAGEIDVVLQYDLPLGKTLAVAAIWPTHVSQKNVKVRLWSGSGLTARLSDDLLQRKVWMERGIEAVAGKAQFPSWVLEGYGAQLPLTLTIAEAATAPLAAFVAERSLVQVIVADDGSQQYRARYFLRKIQTPEAEIELPLPLKQLRDGPTFAIGPYKIAQWAPIDKLGKVVRVPLHPDLVAMPAVLDIQYTIPADALEGASAWRTVLHAPAFRSDVVIGAMRWQLALPTPAIAAPLSINARGDTRWALQGWLLTPEPALSAADLDAWLTAKDAPPDLNGVTVSFAHLSQQPQIVCHFPRWGWWLGCSGLLLIVTLSGYLAPLPRWLFGMILATEAVGVMMVGLFLPGALAAVLFGLQPGIVLCLLFLGLHWCVQERYRRQLVFMTGFSRSKPASTIVRGGAAPKRPREASTVDAPGAPPDPAPSHPSGAPARS